MWFEGFYILGCDSIKCWKFCTGPTYKTGIRCETGGKRRYSHCVCISLRSHEHRICHGVQNISQHKSNIHTHFFCVCNYPGKMVCSFFAACSWLLLLLLLVLFWFGFPVWAFVLITLNSIYTHSISLSIISRCILSSIKLWFCVECLSKSKPRHLPLGMILIECVNILLKTKLSSSGTAQDFIMRIDCGHSIWNS